MKYRLFGTEPANFQPGGDVIIPPPSSCGIAKERTEGKEKGRYCLDWFMRMRKEKKWFFFFYFYLKKEEFCSASMPRGNDLCVQNRVTQADESRPSGPTGAAALVVHFLPSKK